jgi:hypothetical protein
VSGKTQGKVTVLVLVSNRADFIEKQITSFDKYLAEDYEFIIAHDDIDKNLSRKISNLCKILDFREIKIRKEFFLAKRHGLRHLRSIYLRGKYYDGAVSCGYGLQWFWKRILPEIDTQYLLVIDSDMFFINRFSVADFLQEKVFGFIPQYRGENLQVFYPWNGLFMMDLHQVSDIESMDWLPGKVLGERCDVGGFNHHWLKNNLNTEEYTFLTALTIFKITYEKDHANAWLVLNGNWNCDIDINRGQKEVSYSFQRFRGEINSPDSKKVLVANFGEEFQINKLDDSVLRLADHIEKIKFPDPAYFDLIGSFNVDRGFDFFVFHYKSGSNYQKWATDSYNSEKTKALDRILNGMKIV